MFTVSGLAMRFIFRFILFFKLAYLVRFLSFFCLALLLSLTLFFMAMSASFSYFLLTDSLVIYHTPLLPLSFFHILSFQIMQRDCARSDCLLTFHSSLFFTVDFPTQMTTVWKVLPVMKEQHSIKSSLPCMTRISSQEEEPCWLT